MSQSPSASELEELARAVSPPGVTATLLGPDNRSLGAFMSVGDAIRSGSAYFVPVSGHLSVLDLDETDHPQIREKASRMVRDGISPAARFGSGRPGHEHWYFTVPPGLEPKAWPPLEKYGIESKQRLWGGGKSVRPPLSPHRKGFEAHLIEPATVSEAIERLSASEPLEPIRQRAQGSLSLKTKELLTEGDTEGKYTYVDGDGVIATKRSAVFLALAHAFIRDGLGLDEFIAAAQIPSNRGCAKAHAIAQSSGPSAAVKYARQTFEAAQRWRSENPERTITNPDDAINFLLLARDAVADYRGFSSRTEVTDRRVMNSLIEVGLQVHKSGQIGATICPAPGIRRLSEVAGIQTKTARRSLARLASDGWITKLDRANGLQPSAGRNAPTRYRINIKASGSAPSLGLLPGAIGVDGVNNTHLPPNSSELELEAFHRNALGHGALETYRAALAAGTWITVRELSEVTHKKDATVRAHLRKLKDPKLPARLIECQGRSYRAEAATDPELEAIAEHFSTRGSEAKRADRHRKEREAQQLFSQIRGIPHHGWGIVADVQPTTDIVPGNSPAYCPPWT